jgi:hypothetical protein
VPVSLGVARHVAGRVVNADGTPASGATVTVYDAAVALSLLLPKPANPGESPTWAPPREPRPVPLGWTTTGPDGAFRAGDLPDGPYHVLAHAVNPRPRGATSPGVATGVPTDGGDVLVTLPPSTPRPTGRILVRVTDAATGRPVALAAVTPIRRKGTEATPTGATPVESGAGSHRLAFPPSGAFDPVAERVTPGQFEVREAPPGVYDLDVRGEGYVPTRVEGVTVGAGDVQVPTVALSRGVRMHGTVRLPEGVGLRDLALTFLPRPVDRRSGGVPAALGPEGRYEATGLTPGRHRALAKRRGGGFEEQSVYLVREGDVPVLVPEGSTDVEVDLVLVAAGVMRLSLLDARLPAPAYMPDARATDAQVAFGRGASLVVAAKGGNEVARADSLEGGVPLELHQFVVLPGSYVFTYTPPGGPPQTATVEVAAGATVTATIGTPPERR